jgi:hypothetical protein
MKEYHLTTKMMGQIEAQFARNSVKFQNFSKSEQISYRYYTGRVYVYHHEFQKVSIFKLFTNCFFLIKQIGGRSL